MNRSRSLKLARALVLFGLAAVVLAHFCGCAKRSASPSTAARQQKLRDKPKESSAKIDPRFVEATNSFGFRLLRNLTDRSPDGNVFICPPGLAMTLSMAASGAKGETRQEILKALHLEGLSAKDISKAASALMDVLNAPGSGVQVHMANVVIAKQGLSLNQDFLSTAQSNYGAKTFSVDFASPAAAAKVNDWVKQETLGRIDSIVDQFDPGTCVSLVDAVYFDGSWTSPFEKKRTKNSRFALSGGKEETVPLMSQWRAMAYIKGPGFQATDIGYGKTRWRMFLFVPDSANGLPAFVERLQVKNWDKWLAKPEFRNGTVGLPRFSTNYRADEELKSALCSFGMASAFDSGRADFSGMRSGGGAWIGEIAHKTGLVVNEAGTVAAAVSEASVIMGIDKEPRVVADRPFFFAICDNKTGLILFMGAIVNPRMGGG